MGFLTSALFGACVGAASWRYVRFKNGDTCYTLNSHYTDYGVPLVIQNDGTKPMLPWKQPSYSKVMEDIRDSVKSGGEKLFEGYKLNQFYSDVLNDEDAIIYGQIIHEAHLHMRHRKVCKVYLRGDHFILSVRSQ